MARILLVEDDPAVNDMLCVALADFGHKVDCVGSKLLAEMALHASKYDLAIVNVRLQDGSGEDIAATAEAIDIRVILTAGHPESIKALANKGVDFLEKPFRIKDLLEAVNRSLRR